MPDPVSAEEKTVWFRELTDLQESLSAERLQALVGTEQRALLETDAGEYLEARLAENSVVRVKGDPARIGEYVTVRITGARSYIVTGEII
jgi:tRNA-2-methylthio-N6-dimethylallyladenosine synthase